MELYLNQLKFLFVEQIDGIYYSDLLIMVILAALISFVPGYILHVKKGLPWRRVFLAFITLSYLGVILMLTIFRRDVGSASAIIYVRLNLGFTKTKIYSVRQMMYSFLNLLLFVPWGFLLGLFRTSERPLRIIFLTTLTGFLTSSSIEIIQRITRTGKFEVTDLFTNTVGTFLGVVIAVIGITICKRIKQNEF